MPEGLEAEIYRRSAEQIVGRSIATVVVDELQEFAVELRRELPGSTVIAARRHGKLVMLDLERSGDPPLVLGLHFGMAGRLIVDGVSAIDDLAYSSRRDNPAWNRLVISFESASGGGALRVNDPRRWSRFTLDPDVDRLGPDLFAITAEQLEQRLGRRRVALKAALLDQHLVAGLGNMIVDELLWQARLAPTRPANSLSAGEVERLHATMRERLPVMLADGGSHQGEVSPEVRADPPPCWHPACAADPRPLRREQVGGRTTIWCADHQR